MIEPDADIDEVARLVIGAAIEVHRHLGPGYLESVYDEALAIELSIHSIAFERQWPVCVEYKGHKVGEARVDFFVAERLIVELKAVEHLVAIHTAQVISYLKALNQPLGLLVNFNVPLLKDGIRRVIRSG